MFWKLECGPAHIEWRPFSCASPTTHALGLARSTFSIWWLLSLKSLFQKGNDKENAPPDCLKASEIGSHDVVRYHPRFDVHPCKVQWNNHKMADIKFT